MPRPDTRRPQRRSGAPRASTSAAAHSVQTKSRDSRRWLAPAAVFLIALTIRLLHVALLYRSQYFTQLLGDAAHYDSWARAIAAGNWKGEGTFYQAPLYPYLLGLFYSASGGSLIGVRVAQAVLGSASCVLILFATEKWFDRRAGVAAGLLLALYAPAIFFDSLLQKSVLDMFLLSSLLLLAAPSSVTGAWLNCFGLGAVLGALALSRENALVFAPVMIAWAAVHTRRTLRGALVLAGVVAVLAPVAIRNRVLGGDWQLTTAQSGANLYIGNNESATGTYVPIRPGHGSVLFEESDARELAEAAEGRRLTAGEASAYWRSRAFAWMADHPAQFLRLGAIKCRMLLNRVEAADTEDIDSYADVSWPLRLSRVLFNFGVIAPLGVIGWWQTRNRWKTLWPLHAMTILYAGTLIVFFVLDRYRYPLAAFAVMFAGAAIASLSGRSRTPAAHTTAIVVVGLVAAAVCNWPVAVLDAARMRGATSYNLATVLQESGRTEEAVARYRESIARMPGFAPAHLNLGVLLAAAHQQDAAITEYETALRLDPGLADAHNNIASERAARGEYAEAIPHFREALRLDYRNAGTHYNFATALAAAGDLDGARHEFEETLKIDPRRADAHNNLGSVLASQGRYAEAAEQFRAALAANPDLEGARRNLSAVDALMRARGGR